MNFICGILLLHMECDDVFWCLAAVVEDILPKNWSVNPCPSTFRSHLRAAWVRFDGELHGSRVEPLVLRSCVRWKLPKLHAHMNALGVQVNDTLP